MNYQISLDYKQFSNTYLLISFLIDMARPQYLNYEEICRCLEADSDAEDITDCDDLLVDAPEGCLEQQSMELGDAVHEEEVHRQDDEEMEQEMEQEMLPGWEPELHSPAPSQFVFRGTEKGDIRWRRTRGNFGLVDTSFPLTFDSPYEDKSPMDYFSSYLSDSFFTRATECTNSYSLNGNSQFSFCTVDEIRVMFAHHIMMGCLNYPRIDMYYSKDFKIPFFNNLTRRRLSALRTNLHIVHLDNKNRQVPDRMFKVRPIINSIRDKLNTLPLPENLCVDEQVIPFKGKFFAKQYLKGKPTPWGIKVFCLNGKNGMPYDFFVYEGSTTPIDQGLVKEVGFGSAVVLKLAERIPLDSVGHKLYFDNYFPSFKLFEILQHRNIFAAGTIRINRFAQPLLPEEKKLKGDGRGSSAECFDRGGNVAVTRWYDNKIVNLASNFVGIGKEDSCRRWDKNQKVFVEVKRPEVVRLYNESMGGVDLFDQMMQYYRISVRSQKWTVRVIMHFVDFAITAAWMEYREDCTKAGISKKDIMDLLAFRLEIASCLNCRSSVDSQIVPSTVSRGRPNKRAREGEGLDQNLDIGPPRKKFRQQLPSPTIRYDSIGHWPIHMSGINKNNSFCMYESCKQKTFVRCSKCDVFLCIRDSNRNCFYDFHNRN